MKRSEIFLVVIITVVLTLGSTIGYSKYQERKNPQLMVQNMAQDLLAQLKDLNEGIDELYAYQTSHNLKARKQIAVIVPEDMVKPKKEVPIPPVVKTTKG